MTTLPSRHYPDPESFEQDFHNSLMPGIIPRGDFIKWQTIERKVHRLLPSLEFYSYLRDQLSSCLTAEEQFVSELADSLLACDDPLRHMECAFNMLGHTNHELVTSQDDVNLVALGERVQSGDESAAIAFAELLFDLGFLTVLCRNDLEDVLLGVQVGLESNRRKNIGGSCFKDQIKDLLNVIVANIGSLVHEQVRLGEEIEILYGNGLSKKVDFAINIGGRNSFGFEVNFYTVTGSKPIEVRRSYSDLRRELSQVGMELIWITDGKGYRNMRKSLRDAYSMFPNIYNLQQVQTHLRDDLMAVITQT